MMKYRKKLLILTCEFSKFARHKMNIQHSIVFLYSSNEKWEIKKQCQNMKYFGVNMIKDVRDIHTGNYKTLLKAI